MSCSRSSVEPGPGPGRVLGVDRRPGIRAAGRHGRGCRPRAAADHGDPQGDTALQQLPASPDAFVWLRLYQAQVRGLVPAGRDQPLWWTLRRPFRALSYDAARAMFTRANAALGANWSLHDLRHSAAYRMARDPGMLLTDIQWVLGHAHLSTTQQYLTPLTQDVIASVLAFHDRQREPGSGVSPAAAGYRAAGRAGEDGAAAVPGEAWQIAIDARGEVRERRADDACPDDTCAHRRAGSRKRTSPSRPGCCARDRAGTSCTPGPPRCGLRPR